MCPCGNGKEYQRCCEPYHQGKLPENALALMRSRYAAYALGLADYIIETTHPENPGYHPNKKEWKEQIEEFSKNTSFDGLEILEFIDGKESAYVTFKATLRQQGREASFAEKSHFLKVNGRWLYRHGELMV